MSIFKEYDIRGVYPEEINPFTIYKISRGFGLFIKNKKIVVARDARLSSPELHKAVIEGLIDQGKEVIDIGLSTTPMFYFAIRFLKADGGVMITASHLPKNYNGLKLCGKNAEPISNNTGLTKIKDLISNNKFSNNQKGKITNKNIFLDYKKFVLKNTKKTKLKVIIDSGNMMGVIDAKILSSICKVKNIFSKLDGYMPNHEIDIAKFKNLKKLRKEVLKQKADLGIAFDADADRVSFIDDKGNYISPYKIGSLFLKLIPEKNKVIYDLTVSEIFKEKALKYNLKPIISKVGRTNIIELMKKNNAYFGLESSSHYYFKYNNYMDSGVIASVVLLQLLNIENKLLSELLIEIPKIHHKLINIKTKDKEKLIKKLYSKFSKNSNKIIKLDGISIYHDDYWINIRESNTEDLVKITIESKTKEKLNNINSNIFS